MNFKKLTTAALCAILASGGVTPVFADNGVQSGSKTFDNQSNIDLKYSTAYWDESGADKTAKNDNFHHDVGTYVVTIPTAISYTSMPIDNVSTNDDYTVNVRGAINDGEKVTLTADTGRTVSNEGTASQITETTTQGKTEWSVDDCYGSENADGSINGTNSTDNIKMSGTAKTTGEYTGTVSYTAALSKPDTKGNAKYAVAVYAIDQDMDKEDGSQYTHTMTFGPATGGNYVTTSKPAHIALADETDTDKCIHNHTWAEITALAKTNPHVFDKCIEDNCTKTVELNLNDTLKSVGWTDEFYARETGDGPSTLVYELKDEMKVWQPGTGIDGEETENGDNTGGYPASRIRAVLNGADANTDTTRANKTYILSRADETHIYVNSGAWRNVSITDISTINSGNSLLSCFPAELQNSIVPKAVKSDTVYNDTTGNSKTTYDKLWLFSAQEVGLGKRPNEGTVYSRMNSQSARIAYGLGDYYIWEGHSSGDVNCWFLRSADVNYVDGAYCIINDGRLSRTSSAGRDGDSIGTAPGFVIGA